MNAKAQLLTTGDVARLCGFSPSAVLQWIRSNKLSAYSSPGGQHRIDPEQLLEFLQKHGMRIPLELASANGHRILVVEDDESVRDLLIRFLNDSDIPCTVESAGNGVIGCLKIPTFKPDLVVLDLVMPELDGVEMCRTVKGSEEFAGIKVLVITGQPDDEQLHHAMSAGADGWIARPVVMQDFIRKVEETIGLSSATT